MRAMTVKRSFSTITICVLHYRYNLAGVTCWSNGHYTALIKTDAWYFYDGLKNGGRISKQIPAMSPSASTCIYVLQTSA